MIVLYIIGGILILFLLSLFIKLTIKISYANDLQIKLKILFFTIKIYPLKDKEEKEKEAAEKKKRKLKEKHKPPKPKPALRETFVLLKEFLTEIIEKFGRYARLEEYRVKVLVASDNPAKTGILYGFVSGVLGNLSVLLNRIKRRTRKEGKIYTEAKADFLAEEPELFLSIALSMRIWQMFSMGISASKGLLRYNSLQKEKSEDNEQRNAAQTNN